jgi:hypothetical protein
MVKVLLFAGVLLGVPILWMTTVVWLTWRRVRRRNEVVTAHPTRPPLRWLASPEPCARLHRRLRDALRLLRELVPSKRRRALELAPLETLAAELEAHAVSLDRDLIVASRLRGEPGVALRRAAAARIDEIERAVARVAMAATRSGRPEADPVADTVRDVTARLDALDAAWAEIDRIEREVGAPF